VPAGFFPSDRLSVVATGLPGRAVCYVELSGLPLTVLRGLPTWRTAYQLENPKIPTHLHFDATRFRHPLVPSMDELHRLADDFELFLQAQALGLVRRRADETGHEAAFQPAGQYLFEVEPHSGEWLQIGNERALRAGGLPSWYRTRMADAVRRRLAELGPWRLLLLVALMRFTQHRVYAPRLECDETGAQQSAPSLPHVAAGRVAAQWLERLRVLDPALGAPELERAAALLAQWSEAVPGSAADVDAWEVGGRVDKRTLRADVAGSEERAGAVLALATPALLGARYKLYADGRQQGPFALEELAARVAHGVLARDTPVWNMAWDPRSAKWRSAGVELAGLFEQAVPDPADGIPDPE